MARSMLSKGARPAIAVTPHGLEPLAFVSAGRGRQWSPSAAQGEF